MMIGMFIGRMFALGSVLGLSLLLQSSPILAAESPNETGNDAEVLMRGPLHEAFAEVSVDESEPGPVITRPVPDPINEIPPDYRPEGAHIEWIPGYWSWDEDRNDFIWVSGVWRDIPPGRQWIPGYWMAVEGGNRYVSGYWQNIDQVETEYLPPPPRQLVARPSSPASAPDYIWVDGSWIWYRGGYAWQAGYWLEQRPDMIWIPAHYVWTPRGYIFLRGYWDYQPAGRGVMFAPLYYPHPIYRHHDYYYAPSIVLDIDAVFLSLFIRRNSHHYYFGDYYDVRYERRGFYPWYSPHATRFGYDPCYRSYRLHQLRKDRDWERNYQHQFQYRREHMEARPPQIYRRQTEHNFASSHGPGGNLVIGRRLSDVVGNRSQPVRFTPLQPDHKRDFQNQDRKLREFQAERKRVEILPARENRAWKPAEMKAPVRVKTSSSPIRSQHLEKSVSTRPQGRSQEHQQVRSQRQFEPPSPAQPQGKPQGRPQAEPRNQTQLQRLSQPPGNQQPPQHNQAEDRPQAPPPGSQQPRYQQPRYQQPGMQRQQTGNQLKSQHQADSSHPAQAQERSRPQAQEQKEDQHALRSQGKKQLKSEGKSGRQPQTQQEWQSKVPAQTDDQPRAKPPWNQHAKPQDESAN
jgi:WXXGXW repeat (2 copies)